MGKFRRYFDNISDIRSGRNEIDHQILVGRKTTKKSAISTKYCRYFKKILKFHRKNWQWMHVRLDMAIFFYLKKILFLIFFQFIFYFKFISPFYFILSFLFLIICYIYFINLILKNYYHFTLIFFIFILLILFNFKCFHFKILKI